MRRGTHSLVSYSYTVYLAPSQDYICIYHVDTWRCKCTRRLLHMGCSPQILQYVCCHTDHTSRKSGKEDDHPMRGLLRVGHQGTRYGSAALRNKLHCTRGLSESGRITNKVTKDSLPRYPNASTLGALRLADYIGTISFAHSGAILAACSGMDLLGGTLVGVTTALGGGTIRDAIVLRATPFWVEEGEYLVLSILTAMGAFSLCGGRGEGHDTGIMEEVGDAIGVGAFCVIGAMAGVRSGMRKGVCVLCGLMTATFGGAVRDVLCRREVRILHSTQEIYGTTAIAGAGAYVALRKMGVGVMGRVGGGVGLAMALRAWGSVTGVGLPHWRQEVDRHQKAVIVK